jgi:hypothetical protein
MQSASRGRSVWSRKGVLLPLRIAPSIAALGSDLSHGRILYPASNLVGDRRAGDVLVAITKTPLEVSMTDLHETSNQKPTAPIDTVGWLFAASVVVVVVVAAIAAMVAYNANDTTASNAVSHLAGRAGQGLCCRNSSGGLAKFTAAIWRRGAERVRQFQRQRLPRYG